MSDSDRVARSPAPPVVHDVAPARAIARNTAGVTPSAPAELDATRATRLLLRQIVERSRRALNDEGATRAGSLVSGAVDVLGALRELREVDHLGKIRWHEIKSDLGAANGLAEMLRHELSTRAELAPIGAELDGPMEVLGRAAGEYAEHLGRQPVASGPLTSIDQLELARQSLAAARAQMKRFAVAKPGEDRTLAIELCKPIPIHLDLATQVAFAITDRYARLTLKPDVEAVSASLDSVGEVLSMSPKLAWDRAFADAFDSEAMLRRTLGLTPKSRPYSGAVDPEHALTLLRDAMKDGSAHEWTKDPFATPDSAVLGIGRDIGSVYDAQLHTVGQLKSDLQEPPPPRHPSLFDSLLELAVSVALSGAAGALGIQVMGAVGRQFDRLALRVAFGQHARDAMSKEAQQLLIGDLREHHGVELLRKTAMDTAKDAAKELFKGGIKLGVSLAKGELQSNSTHPLNAYVELQSRALLHAKDNAESMWAHLSPSLAQLDLGELNQLHGVLVTIGTGAHDVQYDHSMREWHNFKARLDSDALRASAHAGLDRGGPSDPAIGAKDSQGVLELEIAMGSDPGAPWIEPMSLQLNGAEPASIRYFRNHPQSLGSVGLYQRYVVRPSATASQFRALFGVGTDHRLLDGTVDDQSLGILRLYAAHERVDNANVFRSLNGDLDYVPRDNALKIARYIIDHVATLTTKNLEST